MPVESSIDAADEWFVGEAKALRYSVSVPAGTTDFLTWAVRWRLIDRKGVTVMEKTSAANEVVLSEATDDADPPVVIARYAVVQVAADDYALASAGTYQQTLWRVDPGNEAVLSFGPAVLRRDATA